MKKIPAGKLRQRISIQQITEPENINGSIIAGGWVNVYETSAHVKAMTGKRQLEYGQILQTTPFDIWCRYKNDIPFANCNEGTIKQRYRLVQRNADGTEKRTFTIHSVTDDDYQDSYKIIAYESK